MGPLQRPTQLGYTMTSPFPPLSPMHVGYVQCKQYGFCVGKNHPLYFPLFLQICTQSLFVIVCVKRIHMKSLVSVEITGEAEVPRLQHNTE